MHVPPARGTGTEGTAHCPEQTLRPLQPQTNQGLWVGKHGRVLAPPRPGPPKATSEISKVSLPPPPKNVLPTAGVEHRNPPPPDAYYLTVCTGRGRSGPTHLFTLALGQWRPLLLHAALGPSPAPRGKGFNRSRGLSTWQGARAACRPRVEGGT